MRLGCRGAAHERPARELVSGQRTHTHAIIMAAVAVAFALCIHLLLVLPPGHRRNDTAVLRCRPSHDMAPAGRSLPLCGVMLRSQIHTGTVAPKPAAWPSLQTTPQSRRLSTRRSPDPDYAAILTPSILASIPACTTATVMQHGFCRASPSKKHCDLPSRTAFVECGNESVLADNFSSCVSSPRWRIQSMAISLANPRDTQSGTHCQHCKPFFSPSQDTS
jgi:hypothetical protein